MGHSNHIALQFKEDIFGMGEDGYVLHQVDGSNEAIGTLTNASGSGLAYCDVGVPLPGISRRPARTRPLISQWASCAG